MGNNDPSFESACYQRQMTDVTISRDCYAGTRAIRDKARTYLPQAPAEFEADYKSRLAAAVFWNAFRRTVQGHAGMVFRKDIKLCDDVPPAIAGVEEVEDEATDQVITPRVPGHVENIDLQGTHLDVFAKETFIDALLDGHTHVLVEMPPKPVGEVTLADQQAIGRRPYWVHVKKEQVINSRKETVNGRVKLTQVTIRECLMEADGEYGEKEVKQYRVLRPGSFEVWRKDETKPVDAQWILVEAGLVTDPSGNPLTEIPLATIYANKTGFLESDPPLMAVAHENLRHYRMQSDLDHVQHLCNVPLRVIIGRSSSDEPVKISADTIIDLPVGADMKYVEPSGVGINSTQAEIDRCKANIAALGLAALASKPQVKQTATESVLDYEAETSELSSMARALQDGLEAALDFHAQFLGLKDGGSVEVNSDFARVRLTAQELTALSTLVEKRQLTVETLWDILERGEVLPDDFDSDEEAMKLGINAQQAQNILTLTNAGANIVGAGVAAGMSEEMARKMAAVDMTGMEQ